MALLEKSLRVKASGIPGAGQGLFTTVAIEKGTRIVEYTGRITTWEKVKFRFDNPYLYTVTEDYVIDASRKLSSLGRYVNDAAGLTRVKGIRNNAEFINDKKQVFIVATRSIKPGEEILVGYGRSYWQTVKSNLKIDADEAKANSKTKAKKKLKT